MKLAVCTRSKDTPIICDWVRHYIKIGFDTIFIYDNMSEPPIEDILREKDLLKYVEIQLDHTLASRYIQKKRNDECIERYKNYDWVLMCDDDEFLYTNFDMPLKIFLEKIDQDVATILLNWICFGHGNIQTYDKAKTVYEQFIYREEYSFFFSRFVKSLVRPKHIKEVDTCHYAVNLVMNTIDGNCNKINMDFFRSGICDLPNYVLNDKTYLSLVHYMTLDVENMIKKGERNSKGGMDKDRYTLEWYKDVDFKDNVIDRRMLKYL